MVEIRNSGPGLTFSDYLSIEQFLLFVADEDAASCDSPGSDIKTSVALPAFIAYMKALKDQGRLRPIDGGEGHGIDFLDAWNSVVSDQAPRSGSKGDNAWAEIAEPYAANFMSSAIYNGGQGCSGPGSWAATAEEAYAVLVEMVDQGTRMDLDRIESVRCNVTGTSYMVDTTGWTVKLLSMVPDVDGKMERTAITPCMDTKIVEMTFDVGTGHLIIANWIHLDAFTDNVELRNPLSLNTQFGMEDMTRRHIKENGFLSVYVGETAPELLIVDGVLVVGQVDRDASLPPGGEVMPEIHHGQPCTVIIIERSKLVAIVAMKSNLVNAEAIVADNLAEFRDEVACLRVKPGVHHLYYSGDFEGFAGRFSSPSLPLGQGIEPIFVLSDRRLELVRKLNEPEASSPRH